jgi:hypothetical protein
MAASKTTDMRTSGGSFLALQGPRGHFESSIDGLALLQDLRSASKVRLADSINAGAPNLRSVVGADERIFFRGTASSSPRQDAPTARLVLQLFLGLIFGGEYQELAPATFNSAIDKTSAGPRFFSAGMAASDLVAATRTVLFCAR